MSRKVKVKEIKFNTNKRFGTLTVLAIILFIGCVVSRIYCSTNMAIKNQELQQYYSRKKVLEREISKLEFESSHLSSIKDLEKRASNMGFVHMTETVSLLDTSLADQFASLGISDDSDLGR